METSKSGWLENRPCIEDIPIKTSTYRWFHYTSIADLHSYESPFLDFLFPTINYKNFISIWDLLLQCLIFRSVVYILSQTWPSITIAVSLGQSWHYIFVYQAMKHDMYRFSPAFLVQLQFLDSTFMLEMEKSDSQHASPQNGDPISLKGNKKLQTT